MSDTYYTQDHEWLRQESASVCAGISEYAQNALGDVVFVELPEPGRRLVRGEVMAVVESVKAASEVYAPMDGEVEAVNEALQDNPELVNEAAEGDGWFVKIQPLAPMDVSTLMDAAAYAAFVAAADDGSAA